MHNLSLRHNSRAQVPLKSVRYMRFVQTRCISIKSTKANIEENLEDQPKRAAYDNASTDCPHKINEKVKVEVSSKKIITDRMRRRHTCEPLQNQK